MKKNTRRTADANKKQRTSRPTEEEIRNPDVKPPGWGPGGKGDWYWCTPCGQWMGAGGPPHAPGRLCTSGARPHCTCDTCF